MGKVNIKLFKRYVEFEKEITRICNTYNIDSPQFRNAVFKTAEETTMNIFDAIGHEEMKLVRLHERGN